ncbi:DUF2267 domain-containing protein [Mesorhizobium sp. M00.F.Ca.ET.216.01.1.1]|uniref:DUF2267 domain-containing protein n=1 Tax=Mesorhizobium sp. M00.F.Ca.ET.216.01.1.1 TaxID=2500528 RepID=UPI000FD7C3D1|nr:DUF2267 domain-containing protein [Mesorhizobium sp. M00.F.Ca.ET.216.01.1.1]TGQ42044.1 DUF2267 domain-containing protein [Mesorhizobium sp. M00.F.Ca.ET.216.01.1.1]TJW14886.1 MAG: DUF2267 domain-containing protein [Mesorhizobium sp.]TJW48943.1 MAG: DUF2267 domain-containing protein [Mesorhizobium sp.]
MSATGLDVFDKTLQSTNIWLDEIMDEMGPDRQIAWHVLGAVLHAFRDRLQPDLAAHLGSQLPILVRGAYYDHYQPSKAPEKLRSLDEFLAKIKTELESTRPVDSKDALRVVSKVLAHHVGEGQMLKVWESLPREIRSVAEAQQAA